MGKKKSKSNTAAASTSDLKTCKVGNHPNPKKKKNSKCSTKTPTTKKKAKLKKPAKKKKVAKHKVEKVGRAKKQKVNKAHIDDQNSKKKKTEPETNLNKKKKKKKKEKKFNYNLPELNKITSSELEMKKMPWFQAELQSRFSNRRKCSDDWSHCCFHEKNDQLDGDDGNSKGNTLSKQDGSDQKYKVHPFSQAGLDMLDEEIYSLCTYVRLTRCEIEARHALREQVLSTCQNLFQGDDTKKQKKFSQSQHQTTNKKERKIEVTTFGSFSSLDVSIFSSDIDLALWGIIDPESDQEIDTNSEKVNKRKVDDLDQHEIQRQRHTKKVQKWKDVIDKECEKKKDENNQKVKNSENLNSPDQGKPNLTKNDLFVLDLTIDPTCIQNQESRAAKYSKRKIETINTALDQHQQLDEAPNHSSHAIGKCGTSFKNPIHIDVSYDSEDSNSIEITKCNFEDDFSDEDNADKLGSFEHQNHKNSGKINVLPPPSPSPSDIWPSGTDSDSCSSAEVNLKNDDDDVQVSCFVNHCPAPSCVESNGDSNISSDFNSQLSKNTTNMHSKLKVMGPTGKIREKIVKALTKLGRQLYKTGFVLNLFVRKKARVPIINLTTRSGVDCDIALGGYNGTDTSKFASSWVRRHNSFAPVVVLLKILLRQTDLDKPFTGGLGSYKLYVLVAHHLEAHFALGGTDRPSDVLLSFLYRFGGIQTAYDGPYSKIITELSQEMILTSDHDGMADLSSVFKIENCVKAFGMLYERLLNQYESNKTKVDQMSLLGVIINHKELHDDRETYLQKAKRFRAFQNGKFKMANKRSLISTNSSKSSFSFNRSQIQTINSHCKTGSLKEKSKQRKRVHIVIPDLSDPTNDDEEEIKHMAGYGFKKGKGGNMIPISAST